MIVKMLFVYEHSKHKTKNSIMLKKYTLNEHITYEKKNLSIIVNIVISVHS